MELVSTRVRISEKKVLLLSGKKSYPQNLVETSMQVFTGK
jgi:hypothetical protein